LPGPPTPVSTFILKEEHMHGLSRCVAAAVIALAATGAQAAQQSQSSPAKPQASAPDLINLNTATAAQLESLPGIGPSTAQRILEERQKNGGFKKIEELMNVRGIGEKSFLKLKPLITIGPPAPSRTPVARQTARP
jgi:comEA protein